jgi:hypothetical protein
MMTLNTVVSDFQNNQSEFHKYLRAIFYWLNKSKSNWALCPGGQSKEDSEKQILALWSIL